MQHLPLFKKQRDFSIEYLKHAGFLFLALIFPFSSLAHEGHGEAKKETGNVKRYFSAESVSDSYELFMKYDPLTPGEETIFTLFLSGYNTNAPIDSAKLAITSPQDEAMKFEVTQSGPGTYSVKTTFVQAKLYALTVNINGSMGFDLLLLENIEAGKQLQTDTPSQPGAWYNSDVILFTGGTLAGLLVMFFIMRMREKRISRTAIMLVLVVLSIPVSNTNVNAHEGHNESVKGGNTFSNSFDIPKQTQFLFNVLTDRALVGEFIENTRLFGTVIPSSRGQATVQAPQTAKIVSLRVNVGQRVERGQVLAMIEPVIDAGSLVNFLAEHNNIDAEVEAAKNDYERLKSIEDIASKRELVEAQARYQKAKQNKTLFDKLTKGESDQSRSILLRSAVAGVVGNFTFAIGSIVSANEVLFTVYDLSKVYVEAQVFDNDAAGVNSAVRFTAESTQNAGKKFQVKLLAPAQTINPTNQSQKVIFEMSNPGGVFKIGEFVNLRAFGASGSLQLTVPNSAIKEINGKPVVFIKDNAEQYSVSYLSTGADDGERTVVLKGLEEGERIVTNASYQVKMIYLNQ